MPSRTFIAFLILVFTFCASSGMAMDVSQRRIQKLDGIWQIAEGGRNQVPSDFSREVPVPGLVSLATPAFSPPPGPKAADRQNPPSTDPAREAFWYRRTFQYDGPLPAVARLKLHKAMFGTRVILNGHLLGEHASNATPGWFDARPSLRSGTNELLVRVGAGLGSVPKGVPTLFDREKQRYIPGIFDSVELHYSGTPYFSQVQVAPDLASSTVRVQAVLRHDGDGTEASVSFAVSEAKSGRLVSQETSVVEFRAGSHESILDIRIPIADCRLWSPEDPFLYRLEASTATDCFTTRFGMREFRFDPATQRAMLNGRPYFLRGSNITLYRFFEDPECGDLPWRPEWVRLLHQRIKDMNWNSLRYCIGFPPEAWYDLADELGILIQDEYPLWGIGDVEREELVREYSAWMRERWNHPCVVIWDAQNETRSPVTGDALNRVRDLDLSGRPWDNGWGPSQRNTDSFEAHPYNYSREGVILADLARIAPLPRGGPNHFDRKRAAIINEYGWLWLNRDGSPTTLTSELYPNLAGANATTERRRHIYATHLAADTEFWRHGRQAAAVMHFAALGYSRADGQTSDNWADLSKLEWESQFHRYVRHAFAPVGLMVDYWRGSGIAGRQVCLPVRLLNDLDQPWRGSVILRLRGDGDAPSLYEQRQTAELAPLGVGRVDFDLTWPATAGDVVLEAELIGADGTPVLSTRDIRINTADELGLAFEKRAFASSSWNSAISSKGIQTGETASYGVNAWTLDDTFPEYAVDGDPSTYWASASTDPSWLAVDLGSIRSVSRVRIFWGVEYSLEFKIQVSVDAGSWTDVLHVPDNRFTQCSLHFEPIDARYVRVVGLRRRLPGPKNWPPQQRSHAIREFQVFE